MPFLSGIGVKLLAGLAVVAAVVAVVLRWGSAERKAGQMLERAQAKERELRDVTERRAVERRVGGADDGELDRLRDKWTRR